MASILIVRKQTTPGKTNKPVRTRFHVRWERGRGEPSVHLGVYDTEKLAKKKVRESFDRLALGRIPSKDPEPTQTPGEPMRIIAPRWLERRLKIADSTRESYENVVANHIVKRWGDDDPASITVEDVQDWIAEQDCATTSPATIRVRLTVLGMILKFAKVRPNPVKDDEIELPRGRPSKNRMPSKSNLATFYRELDKIAGGKYAGVVRLMEHTGMRVHEAVAIRFEDWDREKRRLLVPDSKTTAGIRFIDQIDGLPAMPPVGTGRVWPDITISGTKGAVRMATKRSGVNLFSSHDLRKLSISRGLRSGVDPILVSARAGHSSTNITLTSYAKLIPPD